MKNQITFRSTVFKQAYAIYNETNCRFSEALTEAWRIYRLKKAMKKAPVYFTYRTKNGNDREAYGMLNTAPRKTDAPINYSVVTYYDVSAQGIRCFKASNLLTIAA